MGRMKKNLFPVLLCVFGFSSVAFADDVYTQSGRATLFNPKLHSFFNNTPFFFNKNKTSPNSVSLRAIGENVDSDARLMRLAKLQAANYAVKSGFGYFAFNVTRKSLSCKNMIYSSSWAIQPIIQADIVLSEKKFVGALDARQLLSKESSNLSVDAPQAEKDASFISWRDACYSKYPPDQIRKSQATQKMVGGITDALIKFALH